MPPVSGNGFILKVNTGTQYPGDGTPTFTTLANQSGCTLTLDTDEIDTTNKDSANWKEALNGIRSWSIDFEAMLIETDAPYTTLITCYTSNLPLKFQILTPGAKTFTGRGIVTSLSIEGPFNDAATISGSVSGTTSLAYA